MDILYEDDSEEVTRGLEESLESVDAAHQTKAPTYMHCDKRKRKTNS